MVTLLVYVFSWAFCRLPSRDTLVCRLCLRRAGRPFCTRGHPRALGPVLLPPPHPTSTCKVRGDELPPLLWPELLSRLSQPIPAPILAQGLPVWF